LVAGQPSPRVRVRRATVLPQTVDGAGNPALLIGDLLRFELELTRRALTGLGPASLNLLCGAAGWARRFLPTFGGARRRLALQFAGGGVHLVGGFAHLAAPRLSLPRGASPLRLGSFGFIRFAAHLARELIGLVPPR